jgi:hypothetical protein
MCLGLIDVHTRRVVEAHVNTACSVPAVYKHMHPYSMQAAAQGSRACGQRHCVQCGRLRTTHPASDSPTALCILLRGQAASAVQQQLQQALNMLPCGHLNSCSITVNSLHGVRSSPAPLTPELTHAT